MRLSIFSLVLVLLISVIASDCCLYARDRRIQKHSDFKETADGDKILNLSQTVGDVTYKLKSAFGSGTPFPELPYGTYLLRFQMRISNRGGKTIRIPKRSFEIKTDDGEKFQNETKQVVVVKGGEQTSFNVWIALPKRNLFLHPRLVCDKIKISFALPVEALLDPQGP